MIYRKAPRRPVRLLLKVAAVSTLAVAGACGGVVDDNQLHGMVCNSDGTSCGPEHDDAGAGGGLVDSGSNPCAQGCGLVPSTYDGGDDAEVPGDAGVIGVVVNLDSGEDDDAAVVVGVVPHR